MTKSSSIRILVVDDHPLFREGLIHTLGAEDGFEIVAQAEDGKTALDAWAAVRPHVAIIDISMPGMNGIEIVRRLRSRDASARLLMLTSSEDQEDIIAAIDAGASGYITKGTRYADLVAAVREVHHGGCPLGDVIARKLAARERGGPLTPRELEVLHLLREGLTFVEVGHLLSITERTARAHVGAIKEKLGATNTAQAVAKGFEQGLLKVTAG
jgi:DNA-binding NarL/FixJ family response regulator